MCQESCHQSPCLPLRWHQQVSSCDTLSRCISMVPKAQSARSSSSRNAWQDLFCQFFQTLVKSLKYSLSIYESLSLCFCSPPAKGFRNVKPWGEVSLDFRWQNKLSEEVAAFQGLVVPGVVHWNWPLFWTEGQN